MKEKHLVVILAVLNQLDKVNPTVIDFKGDPFVFPSCVISARVEKVKECLIYTFEESAKLSSEW